MDAAIAFIIIVSGFIVITYAYILTQITLLRKRWSELEGLIRNKFSIMAALPPVLSATDSLDREFLKSFTACVQGYIRSRTVDETIAANTKTAYYMNEMDRHIAAYPALRKDSTFLELHNELVAAEEKISFACQFYNKSVIRFNETLNLLPVRIVAGIFNITRRKTI